MATDDLESATARAEAATTASLEAQTTQIEQLRQAVADLANIPNTSGIAARLTTIADRLEAGTAALRADDPSASPTA